MQRIVITAVAAVAAALAAAPPSTAAAPRPAGAARVEVTEPRVEELYAASVEKLLGAARTEPFYLLPTPADSAGLTPRLRPASGAARAATAALARRVARRLSTRGPSGVRGVRAALAPGDTLQLVLGALRFEPAEAARFGRLRIAVVPTAGARQTMEFLLRREPTGWEAINARLVGP